MESTFFYLIEPLDGSERSYVSSSGLILGTNLEDHKSTQRLAKVVGLPRNEAELNIGDVIVVHHNTFRDYYDMKGRLKKSSNFVRNKLYFVEKERIYMYVRDGIEKVFGPYAFVKPVNADREGFQFSTRAEKELVGQVALVDDRYSEDESVVSGDVVTFSKDSEYEFVINDEKFYRVPTRNIVAVL